MQPAQRGKQRTSSCSPAFSASEATWRIDLLTSLKKLAADYEIARKERPEFEQKRMDQLAVEHNRKDAGLWEYLLALERSKPTTNISALLDTCYEELIELNEKDINLSQQKETLTRMLELAEKDEADAVAKLRGAGEAGFAIEGRTRVGRLARFAALGPTGIPAEAQIYHDEIVRAEQHRGRELEPDCGTDR